MINYDAGHYVKGNKLRITKFFPKEKILQQTTGMGHTKTIFRMKNSLKRPKKVKYHPEFGWEKQVGRSGELFTSSSLLAPGQYSVNTKQVLQQSP